MSRISQASLILQNEPSCIELVPNHPQYAVVGTYTLAKSQDDNTAIDEKARSRSTKNYRTEVQIVATANGILDVHFSPHDEAVFCTADSKGFIIFRNVNKEQATLRIASEAVEFSATDNDTSILALSLQWHPTKSDVLATSLSDGRLVLCTIDIEHVRNRLHGIEPAQAGRPIVTASSVVCSHSLEAWTVAFTPSGSSLLTGGDDGALQYATSTALQDGSADSFNMVWSNRKLHNAGVTAILLLSETVFVTGAYDDHMRIIEVVNSKPRVAAELDLGGGVWRLKMMFSQPAIDHARDGPMHAILLASCMYAGARIVKVARDIEGSWSFVILARFEEHQSMNYGSDCRYLKDEESWAIVSTSFYDKLCCLWTLQIEEASK